MVVTARGGSAISGEGCCSWLRGGAALRDILEVGGAQVEWLRSRWTACGAWYKRAGNRTTHLTRPPVACFSSNTVGSIRVVAGGGRRVNSGVSLLRTA